MEDLLKKRKKVLQEEHKQKTERLDYLGNLLDSMTPEMFIKNTTNIENKLVNVGEYTLSQMNMQLPRTSAIFTGVEAILKEDPSLLNIVTTKLYLGGAGMEPFNVKLQSRIEKITPSHEYIMSEIKYYFSNYDVELKFNRSLVEGNEYLLRLRDL